MPVTRERIVAVALELLDEAGLDGLTLRRLADRLGIRAPTLYWHVRDKRELLDLLAGAILEEELAGWREPQPGQPWWEWLADRARVMRTALLAHRDSALVVSGNRPTASSLPGIERQLAALAGAGFSPGDGLLTLLTLNAYVLGDVLDLQAEDGRPAPSAASAGPPAGPPAGQAAGPDGPPAGAFPLLRAANGVLSSPGDRFEHGLGILIDGLRARRPSATRPW
jgi:TetR/AcrR family transcriptional regulator, tetracycline repressor protein